MFFTYKGYYTNGYFDNDNIYYGKIEGITDLVNFCGKNLKEFEYEFHLAVDDYLIFCKEINKVPQI